MPSVALFEEGMLKRPNVMTHRLASSLILSKALKWHAIWRIRQAVGCFQSKERQECATAARALVFSAMANNQRCLLQVLL